MKTALYHNQNIALDQLDRGQYQRIFLAGKNGELSCPTCTEKVRLFLGIQDCPQFFHVHSPEKHCSDPAVTLVNVESQNYIEQNGFNIPKGRTITETTKSIELFRPAKTIEYTVPYTRQSKSHIKVAHLIYNC
jgi:DNA helicase-2/ATP-dependent DNA helicase PcrA